MLKPETVEGSEPTKPQLAQPEYSEEELDTRLSGIRWRLDHASFGTLRNLDTEVPRLVEALRTTTEWLVWGENHDLPFITLFQKHSIFEAFSCALRTDLCPEPLKIQVLQSISVFITKLRCRDSIAYLLSVLNPFFEIPPRLDNEEVVAYFVTLLKSLAIRLDAENVQYCLTASDGTLVAEIGFDTGADLHMPLLSFAVGLVTHRETMVNTAARVAVLNVMQMEHPTVKVLAEDVGAHLLVPKLANFVANSREKAWWRFGNTRTGGINPWRWSVLMLVEDIIVELRKFATAREDKGRPIILHLKANGNTLRYPQISSAIVDLEAKFPRLNTDDLQGFVDDLLDLDNPLIAHAIMQYGLKDNL